MRVLILSLLALAATGLAPVAATAPAETLAGRPDCPGQIVCPQTGELICRDRCSTVDPDRPDCPGRIECPLTGKLVCVDRCPVGRSAKNESAALPPCCRGRE